MAPVSDRELRIKALEEATRLGAIVLTNDPGSSLTSEQIVDSATKFHAFLAGDDGADPGPQVC